MVLYYDDKVGYTESGAGTIDDLLAECRQDDPTTTVDSDRVVETDAGPVRIIAGAMCDCEYKLLEGTKFALEAYDPDSIV